MSQAENQDILNAVGGTAALDPSTTLSTGMDTNFSQVPGQQSVLDSNPNYMKTMQGLMGASQPYTPYSPVGNSPSSHSIGGDSWSSNMSLDPQAIYKSLGLGGQ